MRVHVVLHHSQLAHGDLDLAQIGRPVEREIRHGRLGLQQTVIMERDLAAVDWVKISYCLAETYSEF